MAGFFTKLGKGIGGFFGGRSGKAKQVSSLLPEQQGLYNQAIGAGMGPGAGGAFGQSADYYRGLLGNDDTDFNAFAAPQLRQYFEDIAPNIAEQFAGMGSGGLSSSGFQNAQTRGAVDLAERLGAIRANLRQQGASGLQNIGQLGLQPYSQNMMVRQPTQGFLSSVAPAIGSGIGMAFGGPIGSAIGGGLGSWFGGNQVGAKTGPYGNQPKASPSMGPAGSYGG